MPARNRRCHRQGLQIGWLSSLSNSGSGFDAKPLLKWPLDPAVESRKIRSVVQKSRSVVCWSCGGPLRRASPGARPDPLHHRMAVGRERAGAGALARRRLRARPRPGSCAAARWMMPDTPWIGLAAQAAVFVIPLMSSWVFEGPRTIKDWPRRHVCADCGADWTGGHVRV
jgi:hypothetical protein